MKKIIITILAVALFVGVVRIVTSTAENKSRERTISLQEYVEQQLPVISPEKEVLGGTFFITKFEAENGRGTVSYEDGHNAYTADFTYAIGENGAMSIESFTLRP